MTVGRPFPESKAMATTVGTSALSAVEFLRICGRLKVPSALMIGGRASTDAVAVALSA